MDATLETCGGNPHKGGMTLPPLDLRRDNTFGSLVYEGGGSYGPIRGSYLALLHVQTGRGAIHCDGEELQLVGGECALTLSQRSYSFIATPAETTKVSWCDCRIGFSSALMHEIKRHAPRITTPSVIRQLMGLGLSLSLAQDRRTTDLREALMNAIVRAYLLEAGSSSQDSSAPSKIVEVNRYLIEHLAEDVSISSLAATLQVTPQYVVSAFKKHFGETPARYLWRLRTEHGILLLKRTNMSVSEIAYRSGFKNPYHFSRLIKEHIGHSPTEFRVRSQADDAESAG